MKEPEFTWGPLAQGFYKALLWMIILVGWLWPKYLVPYVVTLLFLGFALKPLLEVSGFGAYLLNLSANFHEKRWRKVTEQRRLQEDRKRRDDSLRKQRKKHPDLPKHW